MGLQSPPQPLGPDVFFALLRKGVLLKLLSVLAKVKPEGQRTGLWLPGVKGERKARLQKGSRRQFLEGSEIVLYLYCGGGYTTLFIHPNP